MVRATIALFLLIVWSSVGYAEACFALLIGKQSYDPSVGVLNNPHNDIALVGAALAKQGFELLPPIKDGKRSAILGTVRDLVRRLTAPLGRCMYLTEQTPASRSRTVRAIG